MEGRGFSGGGLIGIEGIGGGADQEGADGNGVVGGVIGEALFGSGGVLGDGSDWGGLGGGHDGGGLGALQLQDTLTLRLRGFTL